VLLAMMMTAKCSEKKRSHRFLAITQEIQAWKAEISSMPIKAHGTLRKILYHLLEGKKAAASFQMVPTSEKE
jgi:hypothetical protein